MSIQLLCSIESNDVINFRCFQQARPLQCMLNEFHFLFNMHPNGLSLSAWDRQLEKAAYTTSLIMFEDVVNMFWIPVFHECCQLVDSTRDGSVKLCVIDLYFAPLKSIYDHLKNLFLAVEVCRGRTASDFDWIRNSIKLMEHYWDLREQAEAAQIVLELKEKLKLTGDFDIIENVASSFPTSMKDVSLESMSQGRLKEAKTFLEKFTNDERKVECLRNFASCLKIVEWIRGETTGTHNSYHFINEQIACAKGWISP